MDTATGVPLLLPTSPHSHLQSEDNISDRTSNNTESARNSTHGSDGIFDRLPLRSPINGSESEYEDEDEDDLVSEMPADSVVPSCYGEETQEDDADQFIPYTPSRGKRSPFRNPSSVRGMQLDITPPHLRSPTRESMNKHISRLSIGSRNSTPRSVRSYRSGSPTKTTRLTPVPKKDHPLVLLHVTILPIVCPYSEAVLDEVAPPHILENWKLLREKVPDTVLERGILIPHPREEYELLEERLLESLELALPRILKCGHYHREATDDEESETEDPRASHIHTEDGHESDNDSDICTDCTRRVRDGSKGSNGTGKRRWNICIYAANGLMRAGAWSAAWKEMERVDVEISPWMEDGLRRELDLRRVQEEEEQGRIFAEERELQPTTNEFPLTPHGLDEERHREIYGNSRPRVERNYTDILEAYNHSPAHMAEQRDQLSAGRYVSEQESPLPTPRQTSTIRIHKRVALTPTQQNVATSDLLLNYVKLLLQDQRNVALVFLSMIVVWLALRSGSTATALPQLSEAITQAIAEPIQAISIAASHSSMEAMDNIDDLKTTLEPLSPVPSVVSFAGEVYDSVASPVDVSRDPETSIYQKFDGLNH